MSSKRPPSAALLPILRPSTWVRLVRDRELPILPRIGFVLALLYVVFPVDLVPDVAPILGWLDDAGFGLVALGWLNQTIRRYDQRRAEAKVEPAPAIDAESSRVS